MPKADVGTWATTVNPRCQHMRLTMHYHTNVMGVLKQGEPLYDEEYVSCFIVEEKISIKFI
jgi:hypothetical protein